MFLKLCKKNLGFFTPLLNLLESLFHKLCAFNIPIEQSRTPVLLFSEKTHFPDFFFLFLFLNFTQRPCPEVVVSVDTGGSPVRCGSALCRTHWRQTEGRRRAVLSGPRKRPSAGWGLRSCGRRQSGPGRTLRRTTEWREQERQRRTLMSGSPGGVQGETLLLYKSNGLKCSQF